MNGDKKKQALERTFKSLDTEEFLDLYFYRPAGYHCSLWFEKLHIHPNVVTFLSILLGMGAGLLFCSPDLRWNVTGMFLLVWANIYDSCDGQLARMTGQKTRWGRILDGFAGDVWFFFINAAISIRSIHQTIPFTDHEWGVTIFIIASISGFGYHAYQSGLADYYRNIHLFFLKGKEGSELDNSVQQQALFRSVTWRDDFFWKLFLNSYVDYTRMQEESTPAFQRLSGLMKQRYGAAIPLSLREAFRQDSLPLMKYANMLTFNTRCIVLFATIFIGLLWLYFVFEILLLTLLCVYMNVRHERMCNRLYHRILNDEFPS